MIRFTKVITLPVLAAALLLEHACGRACFFNPGLSIGWGAPVIVATGASLTAQSVSFSVAGIDVVFLTTSEINSAAISSITSASTRVTNTSGVSHTLTFCHQPRLLVASGPDSAIHEPRRRHLSGPRSTSVTFQAFAEAANAAFGTGNTNGLQTAVPTPGTPGTFDTGEASSTFLRAWEITR